MSTIIDFMHKFIQTTEHISIDEFVRLNWHTYLTLHWICVQLAHISASIFFGDWFDVQIPCVWIRMWHSYTWIMCDDVFVNCLNGFSVSFYPSHLKETKQMRLKSLRLFFYSRIEWFFNLIDYLLFFVRTFIDDEPIVLAMNQFIVKVISNQICVVSTVSQVIVKKKNNLSLDFRCQPDASQ